MSRVRWLGADSAPPAATQIPSSEDRSGALFGSFLMFTAVVVGFFAALRYAGSAAEQGRKVQTL